MPGLLLLATFFLASPHAAPAGEKVPIELSQLLKEPEKHHGKVVTVSGWYRVAFETSVLQPQGDRVETVIENMVWVYDIDCVEATEKVFKVRERNTETEQMTQEENKLYRRLLGGKWKQPVRVVVRGEFRTSSEPDFGHLGAFKHCLILYKVLEIEESKPKARTH